jgi:hypothetical protein
MVEEGKGKDYSPGDGSKDKEGMDEG